MSPRRASFLRVRALLRKEFRQLFRDPKTRRLIFGSPIIQLLLFGYAVNTDVHNLPLFVVDQDRSAESRGLVQALTAGGHFEVAGESSRASDIGNALERGKAALGIEIPAGFARDLAAGRTARVQILIDGASSNTATVAQGYANSMVQAYGLRHAAEHGRDPRGGVELRAAAWFNPDLASRAYNVPAIIGILLLMMSLLLTALGIVREREVGTLDQLMVSPVSPGELVLGKTIPVVIIAFVDLALVCAVAILWFDVPFRGSVAALLLASFLYILASIALGLLISTVSRTQQEAFMGMILVLLPAAILSGFMYPIHAMPEFFQAITLANPVRHFLEIVRAIFLKGAGVEALWPQYLALTFFAAAVLALATWRFKQTQAA